jgi:hypothetical protein
MGNKSQITNISLMNYCPFTEGGREILQNRIENEIFEIRSEFSALKLKHKKVKATYTGF